MTDQLTIRPCVCGNATCTQQSIVLKVKHGDYSMYTNHKCRCPECREAFRLFRQRYRRPVVAVCGCGNATCTRKTRRRVVHGLSCYFRHKCRCDICMTAMRDYQRDRRARLRAAEALARDKSAEASLRMAN